MPEAPAEMKDLVEKFERNLDANKNSTYKGEQLKQEFINTSFKADSIFTYKRTYAKDKSLFNNIYFENFPDYSLIIRDVFND